MVEQLRLDQVDGPEFLDTLYMLLSDQHRRNALQYLLTNPQPVAVHRLAAELAAIEYGLPVEAVTSDQRQEKSVQLKHIHLPMLADAGIVEWNRKEETVTCTSILDQLRMAAPDLGGILDVTVSASQDP